MKKLLFLALVLVLLAGCQLSSVNRFVGTWIGHGEQTQADTPSVGQTTVTTIDDLIVFNADMTFTLQQGYWVQVDTAAPASAFQKGTGTYSYTGVDAGGLVMSFDPTSDPGLNGATVTYSFSGGWNTVTIQPPPPSMAIVFEKVT